MKKNTGLLILAFLFACGDKPATEDPSQSTAAQIDEYMKAAAELGRFSGSILVAQEGQVVISKGYGFANLEHEIPNAPHTKFRIGSITKQITAMAISILQEKGSLDVQDNVCEYLAECPEAWQPITIHHLLTMTSGIPNFQNFPDNERYERLPTTVEATIERFKDKPLEFTPGERFSYTSSGYVLLGYIIEQVSGLRYEDFLRQEIFEPLGMQDSGYDHPQTVLQHRAAGYCKQGTRYINAVHFEMDTPHAAGALYSTVQDLFLWDQALYTEKLISQSSLEAMFTPFRKPYAYGWIIAESFGRKMVTHGGTISGFRAGIARFPEERVCVIVLSNIEEASSGKFATDLAAIVFGEDYEIPRVPDAIRLDPNILNQYVGKYRLNEYWEVMITKEGDRLMYHPFSGSRSYYEIHAESENQFYIKELGFSFTVVRNDPGRITHIVTIQGRELKKVE
jgi:CubicO group peptidase (beta-lactamase class C family)